MIIRDLFVVYLNTLNNLNIDKIISRIFNRVSFFFFNYKCIYFIGHII